MPERSRYVDLEIERAVAGTCSIAWQVQKGSLLRRRTSA